MQRTFIYFAAFTGMATVFVATMLVAVPATEPIVAKQGQQVRIRYMNVVEE